MAPRVHHWLRFALCCAPLAWLWLQLINHLRVEWTLNPQYNYAWAVPFLSTFLLYRRLHRSLELDLDPAVAPSAFGGRSCTEHLLASAFHLPSFIPVALFLIIAVLLLPTRLIEEANPEWRLVSWSLALITLGLTLLFVRIQFLISDFRSFRLPDSALRVSSLVFPLCYFLVAVPWPTTVEAPLIQVLTRANVAVTIELLNVLGIPALQHGNVIEVATGLVGIDEACSGIRSFQATLMISLFLGELYRLGPLRRIALILSGFALSFVFNVGRAGLLTWVAARNGVPAISKWHDPAGVIILLACFIGLWALGVVFRRLSGRPQSAVAAPDKEQLIALQEERHREGKERLAHRERSAVRFIPSALTFSAGLGVWLLLVEIGVESWYRVHEAQSPPPVVWTASWPTNNLSLRAVPIPETTRRMLRYDEGQDFQWQDGPYAWQGIFLRWRPGRTAVNLARSHTPEICLPAAGRRLLATSDLRLFSVHGLQLPFRIYSIADVRGIAYVFYCLWEDRATERSFSSVSLKYSVRLAPVLAGRRQGGQRSLEVVLRGAEDEASAAIAFQALLESLIRLPPPAGQ